jgi:hypothetical protein
MERSLRHPMHLVLLRGPEGAAIHGRGDVQPSMGMNSHLGGDIDMRSSYS